MGKSKSPLECPAPRVIGAWNIEDFEQHAVWAGPGWVVSYQDLESEAEQDETSIQPLPGVEELSFDVYKKLGLDDPLTLTFHATTARGDKFLGSMVLSGFTAMAYSDRKWLRLGLAHLWLEGKQRGAYTWGPDSTRVQPEQPIFPIRFTSVAKLNGEQIEAVMPAHDTVEITHAVLTADQVS